MCLGTIGSASRKVTADTQVYGFENSRHRVCVGKIVGIFAVLYACVCVFVFVRVCEKLRVRPKTHTQLSVVSD